MELGVLFGCQKFEKPFDDTDMIYDIKRHRYVLTKEFVENELPYNIGEFLNDGKEIEIFLREMSSDVYRLIKKFTNIGSWETKEYFLSNCHNLREIIKEALLAQTRYAFRSGGNLLKDHHGVNIEKGTANTTESIRGEREWSSTVFDELQSVGLLYSGILLPIISKKFERGVDY
jgi:hypothetical protein